MVPLTILWSICALGVIGLALYRKLIASREDDLIHVSPGTEKLIPEQLAVANKLDLIDRWGKKSTIAVLIFGVVIAAIFLYQAWVSSASLG